MVPAHAGGVDLSQALTASKYLTSVPAHAGGVDLSIMSLIMRLIHKVPAHAGGVDLSISKVNISGDKFVPAHAGGVDLSWNQWAKFDCEYCPRPCGRGGFKLLRLNKDKREKESPPMRAGWI